MSRKSLVYDVTCPLCKAKPGEPCVYVRPTHINPDGYHLSANTHAILVRVGKPTQRPHSRRFRQVWEQEQRKFLQAKYRQLRDWFLEYGDILK